MYQVDAFASALFSGNPAAVVILESPLSEDLMQSIALENNLSETAFININESPIPIRWFTPTLEVDLCGHATMASAKIIFEHFPEIIQFCVIQNNLSSILIKIIVYFFKTRSVSSLYAISFFFKGVRDTNLYLIPNRFKENEIALEDSILKIVRNELYFDDGQDNTDATFVTSLDLITGEDYELSFDITNGNANRFSIVIDNVVVVPTTFYPTSLGQTVTFTNTSSTLPAITVRASNSAGATAFYLDNVSLTRVGVVEDPIIPLTEGEKAKNKSTKIRAVKRKNI